MRLSNVLLGLALGGIGATTAVVGCGGESATGGTGGSATSSSASGSSSSSGSGAACAPKDPSCNVVKSECIALADNAGKAQFTLRMAQLSMVKPAGLTKISIRSVVENAVLMNLDKCNLGGTGTFNLLMAIDTATKKAKVGGAKPTTDPTKGYTFIDQMVMGHHIAPVTTDLTIDAMGTIDQPNAIDTIFMPIFLDAKAPDPGVLLPLHKAVMKGKISADQNCIGKYNADKLNPKAACAGDDTTPAFTNGASLNGHMTLQEADELNIDALGQSLCVLISGDSATYGDNGTPIKCKRTAGVIDFKGDWCAATNKAADATCFDAVALAADLAASAVLNYQP